MTVRTESVASFYRNGEILLTGGTGFLGKILIDKLLRSFPDISNIYLMVRVKKGSSPEDRVYKMFKTVVSLKMTGMEQWFIYF